jgi:hypothetical protein
MLTESATHHLLLPRADTDTVAKALLRTLASL